MSSVNLRTMDESQVQILREMADVKFFKTEEEATKYKEEQEQTTGKMYSNIGHDNTWWWCGYCEVGELLSLSIKEAGEYYKLNVPLSGDYQIGKSWRDCH